MTSRVSSVLGLLALLMGTQAFADVTISGHATKRMSCVGGVCTPTAATANLNVGDLQTMLAASSVTVKSSAAAPDIRITAAVTWASASTLTLDAYRSVAVGQTVSITGTAGLTVTTNDGGAGGSLSFPGVGRATFWDLGSSLTINGTGYTLVGDIATLASDVAENQSGNYALAANYDASVDGIYVNSPVQKSFNGNFEGLGNTISNVSARRSGKSVQDLGFFSQVGGTISDLHLVHASIEDRRGRGTIYVGGIAGESYGVFSGDTVSGNVMSYGPGYVGGLVGFLRAGGIGGVVRSSSADVMIGGYVAGGLVGYNQGIVTNSSAAVRPEKTDFSDFVGGLVGTNSQFGTITASQASGTIAGGGTTGGVVGEADQGGTITLSHASVNLSGARTASGGFVGSNDTVISKSSASGTVSSTQAVAGGFVGVNDNTIDQCFATGAVSTPNSAGGFAGDNVYKITNAYALGAVTGGDQGSGGLAGAVDGFGSTAVATSYSTGAVTGTGAYVGGLLGDDHQPNGSASASYWDTTTSGITNLAQGAGTPANDPGITGLTDAALKSGLPGGFDPAIWGSSATVNGGLPYLLANPPR
jgi:hypothetical protein